MTDKKTLEDALAEIEASNAKAAELRAKQAPELIAEAVKRTALNARLAALPQKQRRQVLDAAGLNHVSAAPEPITPVSGRNATQPRTPAALPAIDWAFWRNMRTVKLWQACALVVGLEPDQLKHSPNGWMAGPNAGPIFEDRSFPNLEAKERLGKALRLAESAVSYMDGPIFPQGTPHPGNAQRKDVLLSQVVAFFVSCAWPDIQEQLHTIAQAAAPVATLDPTETKEQRQDRRLAACNAAGLKMDKAALLRLPDGVGDVADSEGVTRQAFSSDIKAALQRRLDAIKEGAKVYRA